MSYELRLSWKMMCAKFKKPLKDLFKGRRLD